MTKFVVDAHVVLHLAKERLEVSSDHELLARSVEGIVATESIDALRKA